MSEHTEAAPWTAERLERTLDRHGIAIVGDYAFTHTDDADLAVWPKGFDDTTLALAVFYDDYEAAIQWLGEHADPAAPRTPAGETEATAIETALERFALARHAISAREGTIASAYRETAVELVEAHNAILALFARRAEHATSVPPDERGDAALRAALPLLSRIANGPATADDYAALDALVSRIDRSRP